MRLALTVLLLSIFAAPADAEITSNEYNFGASLSYLDPGGNVDVDKLEERVAASKNFCLTVRRRHGGPVRACQEFDTVVGRPFLRITGNFQTMTRSGQIIRCSTELVRPWLADDDRFHGRVTCPVELEIGTWSDHLWRKYVEVATWLNSRKW